MLTIDHLHADCQLPAGLPNPEATRARLERVLRERLAPEIAAGLHFQLGEPGAVYRIRQLDLDVWLAAGTLNDSQISYILARSLVRVLVHTLLYGSSNQVRRYADHAHFLAAFLSDLLAGQAWGRWQYQEFEVLRGLPAGQVAANLLAPRPELLSSLGRRMEAAGQLEALLAELRPDDLDLIWRRGLKFAPPADLLPEAGRRQILGALQGAPLRSEGPPLRNALRLYLFAIRKDRSLEGNAGLAAACEHLVRLTGLQGSRPAPQLWRALAQGEISGPSALAPALQGLSSELEAARRWLLSALALPDGRAYLSGLAQLAAPPEQGSRPDQPANEPAVHPVRQVASQLAGLALLLPVLRDSGLAQALDPNALLQLLICLAGTSSRALAFNDPAPAWFSGLEPAALETARRAQVAWPDPQVWGPPEPVDDFLSPGPAAELGRRLLRRFAGRLSGFQASSPAYLAKQFLILPGWISLVENRLEVHLQRAPLGIVLHMAGLDGYQGVLPWLNGRELWIFLPEEVF